MSRRAWYSGGVLAPSPAVAEPALEPLARERFQKILGLLPGRNGIPGEVGRALGKAHPAPRGDLAGKGERFGPSTEQARHLGGRLDVELVVVGVVAAQLGERLVLADPDQDAVRFDVLAPVEVAVVGRDDADPVLSETPRMPSPADPLVREPVLLDLEEEPVLARESPGTRSPPGRAPFSSPARILAETSPERQAESPIRPPACAARSSLSMRGRW